MYIGAKYCNANLQVKKFNESLFDVTSIGNFKLSDCKIPSEVGHEGKMPSEVGHEGKIPSEVGHEGKIPSEVGHEGKIPSEVGHEGKIPSEVGHEGKIPGEVGHEGKIPSEVGHEGKIVQANVLRSAAYFLGSVYSPSICADVLLGQNFSA